MRRTLAAATLLACLAETAAAQSAPPGTVVEYTVINRTSARKDKDGNDLPPFTSAWVYIPWQAKPFAAGGKATVLPLSRFVEPLTLSIASVKLLPDGNRCTGEKPLYEMTGATSSRADILKAVPLRAGSGTAAPIRSVLIYPANPKAHLVTADFFGAADIPPGFTAANVIVGVDLTGDNRPEAVVVEYCVRQDGKPDTARGRRCDDRIQAVRLKGARGRWTEHRVYEPC